MPCSSCKADANPVPLWETHFAAQLKPSHGVYFICGDKAYLFLPPFWSATCSLGYVTSHIDLAWSNTSLHLPVYTNQRICPAVILTPIFLALGLTAGLTGAAVGGTSLHKFQQLSTDTAVSIKKNSEDPPKPTIPVRLPSRNGPTKSSGPRLIDCRTGRPLSISKGRMLFLL